MAHIPSFFQTFPLPTCARVPGRDRKAAEPWRGCWEEFQGLLGFGWDTLRPLLALPHTPTALGPALVLPKHDCPSSRKRKWAHDGVKQVENTFYSPRDISALCATPLLGDHSAQGCRGAQSPCTGWEKGLQTLPRRVLGVWVALLACGVSGRGAEPRWHRSAQGNRRAIHHLLPLPLL